MKESRKLGRIYQSEKDWITTMISAYLNFSNGEQLFEIITFTFTQVTAVVVHGICNYIESMSKVNGKANVNANT
jgi:hypothetical protein